MIEINSIGDLDVVLEASDEEATFIFKHSTVCPTSAGALRRVEEYEATRSEKAPEIYLVKVLESRPLSNEIAQRLNLRHESPQLLLVKRQKAVWAASHHAITAEAIREALAKHLAG